MCDSSEARFVSVQEASPQFDMPCRDRQQKARDVHSQAALTYAASAFLLYNVRQEACMIALQEDLAASRLHLFSRE